MDLSKLSIVQLEQLTGIHRNTVSSKLKAAQIPFEDGPRGSKLFPAPESLKCLYSVVHLEGDGPVQLDKEKALFQKAKRELAELDLSLKQGKYVDSDLVLNTISQEYAEVRSQLVTIPTAMAMELANLTTPESVQKALETKINAILMSLQYDSNNRIEALSEASEDNPDETQFNIKETLSK